MLKTCVIAAVTSAALTFTFTPAAGQSAPAAPPSPAGRPNIVVILSDDMGFSDLGCYGSEIQTPNLDKLASNGLRFTQFYNTARCCPTRACLLTGLYPHQAGVGHMTNPSGNLRGYTGDLNDNCLTIAQVLKPAGYSTVAVGKWHVTAHVGPDGPKFNWPLQRGFDHYYGILGGAASYWDPNTLTRENTVISAFADPGYKPQGEYYFTRAIADNAVQFINAHHQQQPDKPLFMYVPFTAAHWPLHAPAETVAKYKGKYDAGYEAIRRQRFAKTKQLGLIDPKWQLSPDAGQWSDVKNKEWEARCMEVYAAQVDELDQGVGKIVASLQQNNMLDNTLVLFLQDNGACAEEMGRNRAGTRPDQPTFPPMKPTDIQTGYPKQTRDGYPVLGGGSGAMPGTPDTFFAYGRNWANVSNTPFREYKHWVHEGGISTPLIAHWPARIARKGQLETQPGQLIDIMATCVDVSGAQYPREFAGKPITPMEGTSLAPAFEGKPLDRKNPIFWEHEGNRAVRMGQWKIVAKGARGKWELYDMSADRTEMNDLADKDPERVKEMAAAWEAWAKRANALPWPWDAQKPRK